MSTTPNSFDDELDKVFKILNDLFENEIESQEFAVDEAEWMSLIKALQVAEAGAKQALKQLYLTHRNAELEKLLEQAEPNPTTPAGEREFVLVSAIQDLIKENHA